MDLPFVSPGLRAIEMIRRPQATEDPNSLVGKSRMYNMAQTSGAHQRYRRRESWRRGGAAGQRGALPINGGDLRSHRHRFRRRRIRTGTANLLRPPDGSDPSCPPGGGEADDDDEGGGGPGAGVWLVPGGWVTCWFKPSRPTAVTPMSPWNGLTWGLIAPTRTLSLKFQELKDTNMPPDGVPNYSASGRQHEQSPRAHISSWVFYDTREGEVRDVSAWGLEHIPAAPSAAS